MCNACEYFYEPFCGRPKKAAAKASCKRDAANIRFKNMRQNKGCVSLMLNTKRGVFRLIATLLLALAVLLPLSVLATPDNTYYEGMENDQVKLIQQQLAKKGYFFNEPTGFYGDLTSAAVRSFQRNNSLTVDGIAGPVTLKVLFGANYDSLFSKSSTAASTGSGASEDQNDTYWAEARKKYPNALLLGDEGEKVEKMQQRLKELGYYTHDKITGYYGVITLQAVRNFQAANGNTVDGIVGTATLGTMHSSRAVSAGQAPKSSSTAVSSSSGNKSSGSSDSNQSNAQRFISFAKQQLGKPYVYGAAGPRSFDCSGLVQYCYRQVFGVSVPRSSYAQGTYSAWPKVTNLQPGDLLFYNNNRTGTGIDHVVIYIGNGQVLQAPRTGRTVCISSMNSRYVCARRPF